MEQTTINQRLKILIKALDLSSRAFSATIEVSDANTRNYLDRGSKPNSDYLERILRKFESVNPTWLIKGEGTMFLSDTAEPTVVYQKNIGNNVGNIGSNNGSATVNYTSITDCEKDLKSAHEKIAQQASQLQDKERIIRLLEMQLNISNKP